MEDQTKQQETPVVSADLITSHDPFSGQLCTLFKVNNMSSSFVNVITVAVPIDSPPYPTTHVDKLTAGKSDMSFRR